MVRIMEVDNAGGVREIVHLIHAILERLEKYPYMQYTEPITATETHLIARRLFVETRSFVKLHRRLFHGLALR